MKKYIKTTILEFLNENNIKSSKHVNSNINDNFWKWFDNSVMVENGKPMIFYHGSTDSELNKFKESGFRYNGIYVSSKTSYANKFGSKIISLYVSIKKPYIINMEENNFSIRGGFVIDDKMFPSYRDMTMEEIRFLKSKGYDSIIVNVPKNVIIDSNHGDEEIYKGFEVVVFNPNNIKSIDNDGTWDIDDDNIYS